MDKIKGMLFPGSEGEGGENSNVPWWMRITGKVAGIVAGVVAVVFGVMATLSIDFWCWVGGPWQIAAGVVVIAIEAPFCCVFIPALKQYSVMVENRPPWQKAILYTVLSVPPFFLCGGFSVWLGSGLLLGTAALYGMQTIGKKGNSSDMAAAARGNPQPDETNIMDDPGDWNNP